ncbi:MAG: 5-formyltetrahydrofolate cyclo-ligase [Coriobacteriia bacterium]|nr:5-formyltetrahydrofolate cyclo-ligase [Coriobacteriia bacterium]MCL2136644.1 5-formyltetrahydrofolate cyclo-ligase [Coriobacteriia bacterium]
MARQIGNFPHFHQTIAHTKWYYFAFAIGVLALFALVTNIVSSVFAFMSTQITNSWRMVTPFYVLVFSSATYWLRRRGAPIAALLAALLWNCIVLAWYTYCWSFYQTLEFAIPSVSQVLMLGFIPLALALPFVRSTKHVKNDFRQVAIKRRTAISARDRSIASVAASRRLFDLIRENTLPRDGYIAVYSSVGSELSLETLIFNLGRAGYKVAFPAILGEGLMRFYTTIGTGELDLQSIELITDPMEVQTPERLKKLRLVEPRKISVIIVPGVAFDPECYRMGFGGGFYDRYIPKLRDTTKVFGVCFDEQIYKSLPVQSHDQRLDAVVTPTFCYHGKA